MRHLYLLPRKLLFKQESQLTPENIITLFFSIRSRLQKCLFGIGYPGFHLVGQSVSIFFFMAQKWTLKKLMFIFCIKHAGVQFTQTNRQLVLYSVLTNITKTVKF